MSSNGLMTMGPVVLGLDMLLGHVALGAFHNSSERFDPPKCYPKVREAIIPKIQVSMERLENGYRAIHLRAMRGATPCMPFLLSDS